MGLRRFFPLRISFAFDPPWPTGLVPPDGDDPAWPEAVVLLSLDPSRPGKEIIVRPSRAVLRRDRRLLWLINAAQQDKVTIKFRDDAAPTDPPRPGEKHKRFDPVAGQCGPFPAGSLPHAGVYQKTGPGEIQTEPANRRGFFSFDIQWVRDGKVYGRDPAVIVIDDAFVDQEKLLSTKPIP